jgi:hypothetical protein
LYNFKKLFINVVFPTQAFPTNNILILSILNFSGSFAIFDISAFILFIFISSPFSKFIICSINKNIYFSLLLTLKNLYLYKFLNLFEIVVIFN